MSRGQPAVQSSATRWRVQETSRLACAQQVRSQADGGLAGLRQQIECTQQQFLGSARAVSSVIVVPTPIDPMGFCKSTRDVKTLSAAKEHREAVVSVLVSEGLAMVSISARTAGSVVVMPTSADPMEFHKSTRNLKAQSAAKEHSHEVRGGGRDLCVRRPGAGHGQSTACSKFFHASFI